ncbi:MAG TPA: S16 family serine protease [Egibacteraceae bacterium]|nr:S16 family serine protease [Egibacteraceae bacterium]
MRRSLRTIAAPLAAAVLMVLAFRAPLPYFTERPGALFGLDGRVAVQGHPEPLHGDVLFGTVNVRGATLVAAVRAALERDVQLVRRERLIPEGLDSQAFFEQQQAEFALAADVAAAVGLRAAGLPVEPDALRGEGALVLRVVRGGPAQRRLRPGDVVTAVNARPVTTDGEYHAVVDALAWEPMTLTVQRDGVVQDIAITPAATRAGRPSVGLVVSTFRPQVSLPVPVRLSDIRVGGPSAGLAIALTVYDRVAAEDLLAGRVVAATGTLDTRGRVGPIGGVGLKAIAADRAAVDVLLVPAEQLEQARQAGGDTRVRIVGVATFDEALEALREAAARRPRAAA